MYLNEFLSNSINAYLKCERYVNNGSPSKNHNTTSKDTSPKSASAGFGVKLISFSNNIIIEEIGQPITSIPVDTIFVHPDMLSDDILSSQRFEVLRDVNVEPTASGRTVLCKNAEPIFFIKLAYPKCLGRLTRHMGKEKILSACEVTERLVASIDSHLMNSKFALLKENKGRFANIPTEQSIYEWGMIIREFKPYPYVEEEEFLMPFFSLFADEHLPGGEETNTAHIPFLKQFFDAQPKDAASFLLEDIIFPLYDCYFDALLKSGIELEAHAQNMLISFDENYRIKRIICRDLESAGRDITLMQRLGIKCNSDIKYKCNQLLPKDPNQKYSKWYITHSFMFDFKLGEYIVSPLLQCAEKCLLGVNAQELTKKIKEYNQKYIEQLPDFFPPDWCHYSSENFEQTGNAKVYIWEENPKYR